MRVPCFGFLWTDPLADPGAEAVLQLVETGALSKSRSMEFRVNTQSGERLRQEHIQDSTRAGGKYKIEGVNSRLP